MTESLMVKLAEAKANELAEDVRREIISAAKNAKRWLEESQKTREEIAAEIKNEHDEENQYLKNELRYSVARLNSDKELEAWNRFVEKHEPCRLKRKIDGGKIPYITQYGTGIGICTKAHCQVCGESEDITDSEVW